MSNNPIIPLPTDSVSAELGARFGFKGYSSSSSSLSAMGAYTFKFDIGKVEGIDLCSCALLFLTFCL